MTISGRTSSRRGSVFAIAAGFAIAWAMPGLSNADQAGPGVAPLRPADGDIILFRHARAPGTGDPDGFKLADCATQRNLDEAGRQQARRIGRALIEQGADVTAVWTSQWCRTRDTAALAFPDLPATDTAAFNSFFQDADREGRQTAAARTALLGWRGPGVLVVITHQVNVTALTGVYPASGEGVLLRTDGAAVTVAGRIAPP